MMAVENRSAHIDEDSGVTVEDNRIDDTNVKNEQVDESSASKGKGKMKRLFSVKSINKLSFKNDTQSYKDIAEERAAEIQTLESRIAELTHDVQQLTQNAEAAQETEASLRAEISQYEIASEAAKQREAELLKQSKEHADRLEAEEQAREQEREQVRKAEEAKAAVKTADHLRDVASERSLKEKVLFFLKEMPIAGGYAA
ncbi:hypothetical protein SARC_11352 [Sphaeroforma arctica JP610]|uniref:Uncharacterized protein n=1 Tax=Sphaeroforma arctica JP610 TaxID=667725 RepID=A0A0L0FHC0_9EUKA|nr:hypothetical protein SARC_11352 [Sphaeroforma arctica JP610]KNC76140.1 hypothetical protein SARC_11352 [Sphaeroforma arctica JP610]|eukprot:XP_014150042.1 hypothetical protein SARC_11352 [Sphaeroforma arctica JP610]